MRLTLALISLSIVSRSTSSPIPEGGQAGVAVATTSPTPFPVTASFEKRQPAQAFRETSEPILEVIAGSAADALKERASGGDGFDSLLCATLKALKGENPGLFTSLLQSCTSLIDSGSQGRRRALNKRNVVDDKGDFLDDVEAGDEGVNNGHGKALLGRGETNLQEKNDLGIGNIVNKRQIGGLKSIHKPL